MLHWYCRTTYNLRNFFLLKTSYNLKRREYLISAHTSLITHISKNGSKLGPKETTFTMGTKTYFFENGEQNCIFVIVKQT